MDVNKICTKIQELGHINSKRDELREYCKLKFDQVLLQLVNKTVILI